MLTPKAVFYLCFCVHACIYKTMTYSLDVHKAWYMVTLFPQMPISLPGSLSSSPFLPFYAFFLPTGFEMEVTHPQFGGPSGSLIWQNCSVLTQHKHWLLLFSLWISLLCLRYRGFCMLCSHWSMKLNSCGYCEAQFISQSNSSDDFSGKEIKRNGCWGGTACHAMGNPVLLWFGEDSPDSSVSTTGKKE